MKNALIFFLFLVSTQLFSQIEITGVVYDEMNQPSVGATIIEQGGSGSGAVTDFDGKFIITVKNEKSKIQVFYLGYEDLLITVGDKTSFSLQMKRSTEVLEDVVVIGYGTVKKGDLTGSVSTVKSDDITNMGTIGLDQALQGKAPGVVVTQSSGAPGAGASIKIRGVSSLTNSEPLYVIDGIPMDNESESTLTGGDFEAAEINPLALINPTDIASIEILKDASATSIYGSRGANGVVLITTKSGKIGKGAVSINHEFGISELPNTLDILDTKLFILARHENRINSGTGTTSQEQLDAAIAGTLPTNDWQKTILQPGTSSNTNVSFKGGNEDLKYFIGANYLNVKGVVLRTDFVRASLRTNIDANLNERLKVGARINYTDATSEARAVTAGSNTTSPASGAFTRAIRANPLNGFDIDAEDIGLATFTPLSVIEGNLYETGLGQIAGSVFATYKFSNALSFKTNATYQNRQTKQRFYQENRFTTPEGVELAEGGRARTGDGTRKRFTVTNTLSYKKKLTKSHRIDALLGQSIETSVDDNLRTSNYGFENDLLSFYAPGSATFFDPDILTYSKNNLSSLFGRFNYSFKNKLLLTLTGRYDGSSKFATNNKWAFFPAAALAYKMHEEKFFKKIKNINELKFRVSYGTSGNQAIQPYQSLDQYQVDIIGFGNGSDENSTSIFYQNQLPNANLRWETTTTLNTGVDLGFFKNRVRASIEYYTKKTEDLLFTGNRIPGQSGFSTYTQNYGSLETNGFDISMGIDFINTDNFSWEFNGNISTGKTIITDMAADLVLSGFTPGTLSSLSTQRLIIGEEIGAFYGAKTSGIIQFDDLVEFQGLTRQEQIAMYNADPTASYTFVQGFNRGATELGESTIKPGIQLYEDLDNDGIIDEEDLQVIGRAQPEYTFGIRNTFTYKNLDLSVYIDSKQGTEIANMQNMYLLAFGNNQSLVEGYEQRWTPENGGNTYPRFDQNGGTRNLFSDRYIEDASFIRLQNITLGFRLPPEASKDLGITSLRVFASGTNLYTWTNYTGFNPDVSLNAGKSQSLGHDNSGYPLARTIRLGLNLTF